MVRKLRLKEDYDISVTNSNVEDDTTLLKDLRLICEQCHYELEYFDYNDKFISLRAVPTKSMTINCVEFIDVDCTGKLTNLDFMTKFNRNYMYGCEVLFDTAKLIDRLRGYLNEYLMYFNHI